MFSEEVTPTVAQIDGNGKSKPAHVLRADDVIPPFDEDSAPARQSDSPLKGPTRAQAGKEQPKRGRMTPRVSETESNSAGTKSKGQTPTVPEIPTFDLAEHILAEHRRTAAQRRKAPGQTLAEPKPKAASKHAPVRAHVVEPPSPPSQDMLELHQVVAEIVARDIERLCKQPGRPPSG